MSGAEIDALRMMHSHASEAVNLQSRWHIEQKCMQSNSQPFHNK